MPAGHRLLVVVEVEMQYRDVSWLVSELHGLEDVRVTVVVLVTALISVTKICDVSVDGCPCGFPGLMGSQPPTALHTVPAGQHPYIQQMVP